MTPQEEQLLNSLIDRLNSTQLQEKDPDAEALLRGKLGNPDALYMLAQTVLVQNIALDQAKAQISQLQEQAQQQRPQPAHATSFLGRLLGEREPAAPQQQQQAPAPPHQPVSPQYTQVPQQYAPPQYQQPQYVPVGGGQPSFLRGAMQTAAGVAAGALAFEGVESILHGFGRGGYGMSGGYGMGGFDRPVDETVINNYYDDQARGGVEHGGEHQFHENADQASGQDAQFSDASYKTQGDDQSDNLRGFDQDDSSSSFDDSNLDAGSGSDDSGSFDDGGGF